MRAELKIIQDEPFKLREIMLGLNNNVNSKIEHQLKIDVLTAIKLSVETQTLLRGNGQSLENHMERLNG